MPQLATIPSAVAHRSFRTTHRGSPTWESGLAAHLRMCPNPWLIIQIRDDKKVFVRYHVGSRESRYPVERRLASVDEERLWKGRSLLFRAKGGPLFANSSY